MSCWAELPGLTYLRPNTPSPPPPPVGYSVSVRLPVLPSPQHLAVINPGFSRPTCHLTTITAALIWLSISLQWDRGWAQGLDRGRQPALLNNKSLAKYFLSICVMLHVPSFLLCLCPSPRLALCFFSYVAVHPQLLSSVLQTLSFSSFFCGLLSLNVLSEMISSSLKCCSPEASCIQSFDWRKKKKQTKKHFVLLFLRF